MVAKGHITFQTKNMSPKFLGMLYCEHEWWTHECEWWTRECEQVNPSESFQGYPIDINEILFDTWDKIFGDMEKYFATCHGWTIFLDEKDDK
jgi:hypothetical protein